MAIRKEYNQSWNPFWLNMPDGGSKNYEDLENKPSINDVELEGNKTSENLGIEYTLPAASDEMLGGVKVGYGLTADENGVLSEDEMAVRRYQFLRNYGGNTGTHYTTNSGNMDLTVNQYFNPDKPLFFQFEFTGTPITGDTDRALAALNGTFFLTMSELASAKTVSGTYRTIKKKIFMGVYDSKEIYAMVNLEIEYDPYISEDGVWPTYKINAASMDITAADGSDLPEAYISVYLWVRGSKTKVGT